jgi:peptidoglycan/xylan/chitin deacetylase (PgdA/CDA1 family)
VLKVLAYHKVNSLGTDPLTVNTEIFLRHLDYLEDKGFDFVSLSHSLGQAPLEPIPNSGPVPIPHNRCALLTFDHGFSTDYEVVYPLLKAKGYPAIFFLVTEMLGKKDMLGFQEVISLRKAGFIIGSHTISHPRLTDISLSEAKNEIEGSKKILEDNIHERIDFFSYPYGDLNEDIVNLVKEAGYKAAFLISPWMRRYRYSRFTIPRWGIYQNTNFLFFRLKML